MLSVTTKTICMAVLQIQIRIRILLLLLSLYYLTYLADLLQNLLTVHFKKLPYQANNKVLPNVVVSPSCPPQPVNLLPVVPLYVKIVSFV